MDQQMVTCKAKQTSNVEALDNLFENSTAPVPAITKGDYQMSIPMEAQEDLPMDAVPCTQDIKQELETDIGAVYGAMLAYNDTVPEETETSNATVPPTEAHVEDLCLADKMEGQQRATREQLQYYIRYCQLHPELQARKNSRATKSTVLLWEHVANTLNGTPGGAKRTVAQWKESMRRWKKGLMRRARSKDDMGDFDVLALTTLFPKAVSGLPGLKIQGSPTGQQNLSNCAKDDVEMIVSKTPCASEEVASTAAAPSNSAASCNLITACPSSGHLHLVACCKAEKQESEVMPLRSECDQYSVAPDLPISNAVGNDFTMHVKLEPPEGPLEEHVNPAFQESATVKIEYQQELLKDSLNCTEDIKPVFEIDIALTEETLCVYPAALPETRDAIDVVVASTEDVKKRTSLCAAGPHDTCRCIELQKFAFMDRKESRIERQRRLSKERQARWRASQCQESLSRIREADAESKRLRRKRETPEETQARRQADAAAHRQRIQRETAEETKARREANAASQRRRIASETPEQRQARREADAAYHRQRIETESAEASRARKEADAQRRRNQRLREEALKQREAEMHQNQSILDYTQHFLES